MSDHTQNTTYKHLGNINSPKDLKKLAPDKLEEVCQDLRNFLIAELSRNPGHFGASLGVVELTVALHYALNTPDDKLIWDVGHQAYCHKILTGRRDNFHTNRKLNGLSGFPRMDESPYDAFGTGHSSTSISAALGMATANRIKGEKNKSVAVIGDGSLTGGMAFEAMNNMHRDDDVLVILNDNNMAIDDNVGSLNQYLLKITKSRKYNKLKSKVWDNLSKMDGPGKTTKSLLKKITSSLKFSILDQSNFFEALNLRYFGPIYGHDVESLVKVLKSLNELPGAKLLHVVTQKGKGYSFAENQQTVYHAPGKFCVETGKLIKKDNPEGAPLFQDVFGKTLLELARKNDKIAGITPAMPSGCSMTFMMEEMPDRTFDVGIAEQHAVTFAAGLATKGILPFCNIYSSFMQRAYDQVIHDVALQKLNVVFCLDRGGLVGNDGATHHGVFDLAYMRSIPNMTIFAPMDVIDLRNMMYTAQKKELGAVSIRYPRGSGCIVDWQKDFEEIEIGKACKLTEGKDLAILTVGKPGLFIKDVQKELENSDISIAHYDFRFVKPLDEEMLHDIFNNFNKIVTVEDGTVVGGFGSAVAEFAMKNNYHSTKIEIMGVPDSFVEHGTQEELYNICGFNAVGISNKVKELCL
ncbi:MAG: 1-deoxy-D-xylulose-5-phosphate synthase [Bacteroidales bacterium]